MWPVRARRRNYAAAGRPRHGLSRCANRCTLRRDSSDGGVGLKAAELAEHESTSETAAPGHMRSRSRARLQCPRERECGSRPARCDPPARRRMWGVFARSRLRRVHMRRGAHRQLDIAAPCDRDARGPSERPTCRALRVWAGCSRSSSISVVSRSNGNAVASSPLRSSDAVRTCPDHAFCVSLRKRGMVAGPG